MLDMNPASSMAVAAVDRLVDHSTILRISGEGCRRRRADRMGRPAVTGSYVVAIGPQGTANRPQPPGASSGGEYPATAWAVLHRSLAPRPDGQGSWNHRETSGSGLHNRSVSAGHRGVYWVVGGPGLLGRTTSLAASPHSVSGNNLMARHLADAQQLLRRLS